MIQIRLIWIKAEFSAEDLFSARASLFHQWTWDSRLPNLVLEAWSSSSVLDRYWFTNKGILETDSAFVSTLVWPQSAFCGGVNSIVDICYVLVTESASHCFIMGRL